MTAQIRIEELVAPRARVFWITEDGDYLTCRDTFEEALRFARAYCRKCGAELISAEIIPFPGKVAAA